MNGEERVLERKPSTTTPLHQTVAPVAPVAPVTEADAKRSDFLVTADAVVRNIDCHPRFHYPLR